jgi:hypothetical protein
LIRGWNFLSVSLGIKIITLNSIEGQFMKDEKAIDWREGFSQLPLDKENKLKEGSWQT